MPKPTQPANATDALTEGVEHFRQAMAIRGEMNLRVARRVTSLTRGILWSVALVLVLSFVMMYLLIQHTQSLITTVDTMNRHMTSMTADMGAMRSSMSRMEQSVANMNSIEGGVEAIAFDMYRMDGLMGGVSTKVASMDENTVEMARQVQHMAGLMGSMQTSVGQIGANVNHMSSPIRLMNRWMPFW